MSQSPPSEAGSRARSTNHTTRERLRAQAMKNRPATPRVFSEHELETLRCEMPSMLDSNPAPKP